MPEKSEQKKVWLPEEKNIAALGYIPVVCLIILILRKDHPFISFHAKQGLTMCLCFFLFWYLPIVGTVLNFFLVALIFVGLIKAKEGEFWKAPFLGNLAAKIKV